jgi:Sec-independent protein translocase protein TatA|tara:strand:+ start:601 stop:864 length:264 start_codon:yes stop_codon:yes gene_type:complete
MFNLSFGEIALIIILAILFLKPQDLPNLINNTKKAVKKFLTLKNEFLSELDEFKDEVKEIEEDLLQAGKIKKNEEMVELKKDKKDDK